MTRFLAVLLACLLALPAGPALALSVEELNAALPGMREPPPGVTPWSLLGKASVQFHDKDDGSYTVTTLIPPEVEALDGQTLKLMGFMVPVEADVTVRKFLLVETPADCPFCLAGTTEPSRIVEVEAGAQAIALTDAQVVLSGRLEVLRDDMNGLVYRLRDAVAAAD
jgi:hypothetical protein